MTATDPVDLAREVLEREERLSAYSYSIPLAAQALWDATRSEQVKAAPVLALAVERVTALADRLDAEAERMGSRGGAFTARAFAAEIRDALNGETNE